MIGPAGATDKNHKQQHAKTAIKTIIEKNNCLEDSAVSAKHRLQLQAYCS